MSDLKGRVALVTGSTRGIGKGIALELARKGAYVIVNGLPNEDNGDSVVELIKESGGQGIEILADVSQLSEVENLFATIKEKFGKLDILINNAGTSQDKDIFEIDENDWDRILNTNLTSGFYCSKLAMNLMKDQKNGKIVFITSVVAHRGALFGHVHYAASKSGQLGMMRTLARTGAPLGINVNAVAPGIIGTDLLFKTHGDDGVQELETTIPMGLGRIEDIGYAVSFLCSDEARYISGTVLDVNGGLYFR